MCFLQICEAACKCKEGCEQLIPHPAVQFTQEEEQNEEWRRVSENEKHSIKIGLEILRDEANINDMLPAGIASGLTDDVIQCVIKKAPYLTSADDVVTLCPVYSFDLARQIWKVLDDIFQDGDVMEEFDYCSDDD